MVWILQVKVQRNTLALNLEINEVKTVEVELDDFVVLLNGSRSEDNGHLELVLLTWHENLTWDDLEVEECLLLEVSLKRDCLGIEVGDLEHLLDWSRLCGDEA